MHSDSISLPFQLFQQFVIVFTLLLCNVGHIACSEGSSPLVPPTATSVSAQNAGSPQKDSNIGSSSTPPPPLDLRTTFGSTTVAINTLGTSVPDGDPITRRKSTRRGMNPRKFWVNAYPVKETEQKGLDPDPLQILKLNGHKAEAQVKDKVIQKEKGSAGTASDEEDSNEKFALPTFKASFRLRRKPKTKKITSTPQTLVNIESDSEESPTEGVKTSLKSSQRIGPSSPVDSKHLRTWKHRKVIEIGSSESIEIVKRPH